MAHRVVLVTGAAKRVGRSIAEYFGARGYHVVVHYGSSTDDASQTVERLTSLGAEALARHADLSDAVQIEALVEAAYQRFGRLDVLVNSASVFPDDHLDDFALEAFDHAWAVNGRAPLLLTRAFYLRAQAAGQCGVVVNVVDQKVRDNFHRDHFSYTVGKAAIGNMTAMLARSAAPVLRVNAVYPGLMLPSGDQTQADFEHAQSRATPLGRIATPEDLASAIMLLTGDAYNGVDWVVDGGQNLVKVSRDVVFEHRSTDTLA
jgi:pteridine reductase